MPSQPEDEFVLVLSTAGGWNVNIEPDKLLVSKTLAMLRSRLVTIWSTSDHAMIMGCLWASDVANALVSQVC